MKPDEDDALESAQPAQPPEDEAVTTEEDHEPVRSARDLMLDSLGEAREREVMAESGETPATSMPGQAPSGEEGEGGDEEEKDGGLIKVKVDGVEAEVTEDDIRDRLGLEGRKLQPSDIRAYQKHVSADRRLQQAAEERRELDERTRAIEAKETALRAQEERAAAPPPKEPAPDPADAEARELYDSLFSGDEAGGIEVIKKIITRPQAAPEPVNVASIASQAAELAQRQLDWTAAQKEFVKDYPDLAGDQLLAQIAENTLQETLKTSRTYSEAFHKAGEATRTWLGAVSAKPANGNGSTGTPDDPFKEKRERKESLAKSVQSAGGRATPPPEAEGETPAEVIALMRKSRGLSS